MHLDTALHQLAELDPAALKPLEALAKEDPRDKLAQDGLALARALFQGAVSDESDPPPAATPATAAEIAALEASIYIKKERYVCERAKRGTGYSSQRKQQNQGEAPQAEPARDRQGQVRPGFRAESR